MNELACGIDIGCDKHSVTVIGSEGSAIFSKELVHDLSAIRDFIDELKDIKVKHNMEIIIGMEGAMGYASPLDKMLLVEGFEVIQINSYAMDKYRKLVGQPKKNDKYCSKLIASFVKARKEFAVGNETSWHKIVMPSKEKQRLRILCRLHKQITKDITRESNRMIGLIHGYFPSFLSLYEDIKSKGSLSLLKNYADVEKAKRASVKTIAKMKLDGSRYHLGEKKAEEFKKLVSVVDFYDEVSKEISYAVSCHAERIIESQRKETELAEKIINLSASIEEVAVVKKNIKGAGDILAARLVSEIGEINKFENSDKLAVYCGVACLDNSSGKREFQKKVIASNRQAKDSIMRMAFASLRTNDLSRAYYNKKRKEGKGHYHTLKCLSKHMLRYIFKILNEFENEKLNCRKLAA